MSEMFKKASFLDGFDIPEITHDAIKKSLIKLGKTAIVQKRKSIEGLPLDERLKYIEDNIYKILGRYRNFINIIRNDEDFLTYIDRAIAVDYLAYDTETNNSLDPLTCKLMGLCCYIPNTKPVYIPLNHCVPGTDILLENQVSRECVIKAFNKLKEKNTKIIYHNGKFDIRATFNNYGMYLPIWWDTMIAAQLLDENELARLKYQYKVHVNPTIDTYNIEKLFTGLPYAWIDPEIFALYAAIDAYDTYKLQQIQQIEFEKSGMENIYNLFLNIEIPIVTVTSQMEDNGICIDLDFVKKLDAKYVKGIEDVTAKLNEVLKPYEGSINYYQNLGKLDTPVNYDSAEQLSLLLYDIVGIKNANGTKSTSKDVLKNLKNEIADLVLEYRHYSKLRSAFTTALPLLVSPKDGKIHANFNQMGKEDNNVRTGRFSSTNP